MYLFFVRDFNDIDHITPIVWKMKGDGHPVAVYCMNPEYDIQSDYRLNFLKELGVKVDFIYNAFDEQLGWLHATVEKYFSIHPAAEVAVEVDPRVTTREHIDLLCVFHYSAPSNFNRHLEAITSFHTRRRRY